jgi:hypothetical protein
LSRDTLFRLGRQATRHKTAAVPRGGPQLGNLDAAAALADIPGVIGEFVMPDNRGSNGTLGAILGALIVVALAVFLFTGGEHLGKKTVNSDRDLPPVATGSGKSR